MRITPQDWRVTASMEADRCVGEFADAHEAALDSTAQVLQRYWAAYLSAGAAVGALVHAEIADGLSWPELARALGLPPEEAEALLEPLTAEGLRRLRRRLPDA